MKCTFFIELVTTQYAYPLQSYIIRVFNNDESKRVNVVINIRLNQIIAEFMIMVIVFKRVWIVLFALVGTVN